mgnify:CR=1 FL=1
MSKIFDSRDTEYKSPFGAAVCGATVRFAVRPGDENVTGVTLLLRREFAGTEQEVALSPGDDGRWQGVYTAPEEPESGLRGFYAQPDGSARIMVLHGDVGSREGRYRPIAPEEIASTGLDYLALGHVHAPSAMNRAGSTVWAYPGCPQGRGFDETGDRGFLFGDVEPGRVDMQFVPFARRRYEILTVDVSQGDALETIRRRLPPDTSRDIYRIRLTGETAEPLTLPALEQALSGGFFQLELVDDTRLRRDLWDRCGDDTLRGLFLRRLRREYDAADPRRQKEIEQAVRFGLAAMDNKEL